MFRVILGLVGILGCGAIFAAMKLGVSKDALVELARQQMEEVTTDLIPEVQLEVIASQMQAMCPVAYDDKITLVEVTTGPGLQLNARYRLATTRTTITAREQAAFRQMAIEQFSATGVATQMIGQKIQWRFIYETSDQTPLFELTVMPEDFVAPEDGQMTLSSENRPPSPGAVSTNTHVQPVGANNQIVKTVPLNQVHDMFFEEGDIVGGRSPSRTPARGPTSGPRMQANPFIK